MKITAKLKYCLGPKTEIRILFDKHNIQYIIAEYKFIMLHPMTEQTIYYESAVWQSSRELTLQNVISMLKEHNFI